MAVPTVDGRVGRDASDLRRSSILDAALECFTSLGYEPTTVTEIRVRSGATTGTLYHYFPGGKVEIAAWLHVDCLRRYQDDRRPVLAHVGEDAERGVRSGVRYHLEWIAANPRRARFLFADRPAEVREAVRVPLEEMNRRFFAEVGAWLDRQIAAGAIRQLPKQVLYALWVGPAQQVGRQLLEGEVRIPLPEAIDLLAEGAWRALRAGPAIDT